MMQQWRAARARVCSSKPDVKYPQLVPAQQQAARVRHARQQRMLRMYQRHCTEEPEEDEDMALSHMLEWCSELNIADYFECARVACFCGFLRSLVYRVEMSSLANSVMKILTMCFLMCRRWDTLACVNASERAAIPDTALQAEPSVAVG